jgi:hypothetical protein
MSLFICIDLSLCRHTSALILSLCSSGPTMLMMMMMIALMMLMFFCVSQKTTAPKQGPFSEPNLGCKG